MARVTVKMFATVREAAGTDSIQIEAETLSELLEKLGSKFGSRFSRVAGHALEEDMIVILVNGRNPGRGRAESLVLSDGDEVALFPPVSGG